MVKTKSVLILTIGKTEAVKEFARNVEKVNPNVKITLAAYYELDYLIDNENSSFRLSDSGKDIADFDIVHLKTTIRYLDVAAGIAWYLDKRGTKFVSRAAINFPSTSKFYQYVILSDNGIAIPRSLFILPRRAGQSFDLFVKSLGLPFILKDINGSKGDHNFLVHNEQDFAAAVIKANQDNVRMIGQTFIPNSGDYRILILGQQIALVINRIGAAASHINNVSKSGTPKLINPNTLPAEVQAISLKAAKLLDREIAGVDMVQESNSGAWYCFEVNDGPQIATGSFKDEKVRAYSSFIEKYLDS